MALSKCLRCGYGGIEPFHICRETSEKERNMYETRKEKLGRLGEELVARILGGTLSENKYDDVKDMTLPDGTQVEVKTQARWVKQRAFTMDQTTTGRNLQKCLEVDRLIFVEPGARNQIRIFECIDRTYRVQRPRGKETYLFDINNMKLITTVIDADLCEEMISVLGTPRDWLV